MISPFKNAKKKAVVFSLREAIRLCIKKKDDTAKEYLYKQYYGYVMAVVLRYVKNAYDAEELVNECYMRVFTNIETFTISEDDKSLEKMFLGWMARIASNLSIDHLRAKKQLTLMEDSSSFEYNVKPINPATDLEVADILKMLDQLPQVQRAIFNLFEIEGYSHEEISKQLAIPESTSRTYLTRAKKKLREIYLQINDN